MQNSLSFLKFIKSVQLARNTHLIMKQFINESKIVFKLNPYQINVNEISEQVISSPHYIPHLN
jgi:hypothetical protein